MTVLSHIPDLLPAVDLLGGGSSTGLLACMAALIVPLAMAGGHDDHGHDEESGGNTWAYLIGAMVVLPLVFILMGALYSDGLVTQDPITGRYESSVLLLIILFPAIGALFNGTIGQKLPRSVVNFVGCAVLGLSFFFSLMAVKALVGLELPAADGHSVYAPITYTAYTWIASGSFQIPVEFLLDPLSAIMILVITGVGFLIHVYSAGYMAHDRGYARYFAYLNLFCFSMLLLVLGANLMITFVGWEGVGMCSYLLIGFWFTDDAKATAGKKAFVTNRVGDFAFIIGLFILFFAAGSLDYQTLAAMAADPGSRAPLAAVATAVTLLLFIGCTGKSAQIPLYVWLPDAMAGPTPVSALIHAATMVTAGVYLIARLNFLYVMAPVTMWIVAGIGALTAIMAASIGLVQNDIKKVLAYSTVSQLGYMFMAVGVGAFTAGIFHLMTHAFFKALLFLGSGAVIHAMHEEQDIRKMGGLRKYLPVTHWTFFIACLAIAGVPGFSGFFSKDEILWNVFALTHVDAPLPGLHIVLWIVGVITAGLTAFYMFRLYFMTFWGECRADEHTKKNIHAAPVSMGLPLAVLAVLSIVGGYIGIPAVLRFGPLEKVGTTLHHWLEQVFLGSSNYLQFRFDEHAMHTWEWVAMGASVVVAFSGIALAFVLYGRQSDVPDKISRTVRFAHQLLMNKYWVDEVYEFAIIKPFVYLGRILHKLVDELLIDIMLVRLTAFVAEFVGSVLRRLQNGNVQRYAAYMLIGLGAIVFLMLYR